MKHTMRWLGGCLLMLAGLFILGCSTARMAVPSSLQQRSDVLHCVGRQGFMRGEKFTFGDYEVQRVRRGWVRRVDWELAVADGHAARQEFEFDVRSPDGTLWQGHAVTGVRREDIHGSRGSGQWTFNLASEVNYVVRFADENQEYFWVLTMAERLGDTVPQGELTDGSTVYRVEGTYQLADTNMPLLSPAGYLLYQGPRAMAAVEIINKGAVFLDREAQGTERDALAVAATALLLYRDIAPR